MPAASVTRNLCAPDPRVMAERRCRLPAGLWLVRLRSPFARGSSQSARPMRLRMPRGPNCSSCSARQRAAALRLAVHEPTPRVHALLQLPRRLLIWPGARLPAAVQPWLGNVCRYDPSCSQYALDALQRHGAAGRHLPGGVARAALQPLVRWAAATRCPKDPPAGLFTRLCRRPATISPESKKLP
jgi:hypothetical protein